VIGPERRDAERPDFAFRQWATRLGIDDFDEIHIGPDVDAVVCGIFRAHQTRLAHAEDVEDLSAPKPRELFALGGRQRFRRADKFAHRTCRKIDALRFGQIGEMKRKTAHADEYRRPQRLDQLELRNRRIRIARADPNHPDAEHFGAACPDLAGRMDAERKGDVAKVAGPNADARERAAP